MRSQGLDSVNTNAEVAYHCRLYHAVSQGTIILDRLKGRENEFLLFPNWSGELKGSQKEEPSFKD